MPLAMTQYGRKFWVDPQFRAANVREVDVPASVLARLAPLATAVQALAPDSAHVLPGGLRLNRIDVRGWNSDIAWLSQDDHETFAFFEGIFTDIGLARIVAPHVAVDRAVVMYSAFFVTRSHCDAPHFHRDWQGLGNQAFTFLAPLSDNCGDIALTYRTLRGEHATYEYRPGKGILFGDDFWHSTAPGRSDRQTVMLSYTFGTDRMDRYADMLKSAYQGPFHRRPDGVFVRNGQAIEPQGQ